MLRFGCDSVQALNRAIHSSAVSPGGGPLLKLSAGILRSTSTYQRRCSTIASGRPVTSITWGFIGPALHTGVPSPAYHPARPGVKRAAAHRANDPALSRYGLSTSGPTVNSASFGAAPVEPTR